MDFTSSEEDYLTIENIDNVNLVIDDISKNYNYITNIPTDLINSSDNDNKYINFGIINNLLKEESVLTSEIVAKLAIAILLDDLDFDKTILLVNYLLNNGYNLAGLNSFEKELLVYYETNFITSANGKLKALMLPKKSDFKNYTLYIIKKSKTTHISGANILMVLGETEDYDDFNSAIVGAKLEQSNLASALGFLSLEKNKKEFITYFKTKSGSNKGSRSSRAGKAQNEKLFVAIGVPSAIIAKLKKYNQNSFSNALEIYFRYYDLIKKDDKHWFFNLVQSLINEFN